MVSFGLRKNYYALGPALADEQRTSTRNWRLVLVGHVLVTLGVIAQSGCVGVASRSASAPSSSVCAPTASGVCYYVSPAGSDSNAGTSVAPFQTIQHAANVVNPGDMVIVRDGTYNNAAVSGVGSKLIVMSRGGTAANHVVFTAEHKWGAKIDGLNNTSATGWEFSANYIDVKNFECEGFSDTCMENYNGELIDRGKFISITGKNIHHSGPDSPPPTTGPKCLFPFNYTLHLSRNPISTIKHTPPPSYPH